MDEKVTKDEKKALRQEEWREKADKEKKNKLYKTIAFWSGAGMLVILGIWALVAFSTGSTTSQTSTIKIPSVTAKDFQSAPTASHGASQPGKIATLVEYADFECPACKAYYPVIKQLQTDFGTKLHLVYRFFPLKTIHPNAVNSAKAAYAASLQGKFWDMHDLLFTKQDEWAGLTNPEAKFISYAKSVGLNTTQFQKDYEARTTEAFVNAAYDQDSAIGLNSTPTFFLNGKQIDNPSGYTDFKTIIAKGIGIRQ